MALLRVGYVSSMQYNTCLYLDRYICKIRQFIMVKRLVYVCCTAELLCGYYSLYTLGLAIHTGVR